MSSDWDDDDIGYGRPPRWTRFEKGCSGNPKGRPKKPKDTIPGISILPESEADRALRRELDRKIRTTDANGTMEVTMADAVVRAQVTKAAQGHVPAIRDVRRAQRELEKVEAERARLAAEQAAEAAKVADAEREQTFTFVCQLKEDQAKAWAVATGLGKNEPDNPWPHPDEIVIDFAKRSFSVRGPVSDELVPEYECFRAHRDKFFVETIVWMRARGKEAKAKASFYAGLLGIYDSLMPSRWALGLSGFEFMATVYLQMPLKFLREDLERAEQKVRLLTPERHMQPIRLSEFYPMINKCMKPNLKKMGYVSYAQFEVAWEDTGGKPPWPKGS